MLCASVSPAEQWKYTFQTYKAYKGKFCACGHGHVHCMWTAGSTAGTWELGVTAGQGSMSTAQSMPPSQLFLTHFLHGTIKAKQNRAGGGAGTVILWGTDVGQHTGHKAQRLQRSEQLGHKFMTSSSSSVPISLPPHQHPPLTGMFDGQRVLQWHE